MEKLVTDGVKQGSLKVAKTKSFFRCGARTIILHNSPTVENSFVKQWNAAVRTLSLRETSTRLRIV